MSKQPEAIFGEKVDRDLKRDFGKDIWVENIQQVGKIGTPDRLICLAGVFIGLELKLDDGVTTRIQMVKLFEIKRAGGRSFVAKPSNWKYIRNEIKKIYGHAKCRT